MFRWSTSQFRILCKDNPISNLVFEITFPLSRSLFSFLSLFRFLFILKYVYLSTLGCCLFPFYLPLALFLSDGEKEVHIAFSPCPLVLFVYLPVNYADISPLRKLVCATARRTVHLWTLPGLMCLQGQICASGEEKMKRNHKRKQGGQNRRSRYILWQNISASVCVAEPKRWSCKDCSSKTPLEMASFGPRASSSLLGQGERTDKQAMVLNFSLFLARPSSVFRGFNEKCNVVSV